jgi:hypothetical protein
LSRLLANFLGFCFRGKEVPSSNYTAVAGDGRRDNQHGNVLKSLRAENTKLRERAVDIILEIEKIREAKYGLGPR